MKKYPQVYLYIFQNTINQCSNRTYCNFVVVQETTADVSLLIQKAKKVPGRKKNHEEMTDIMERIVGKLEQLSCLNDLERALPHVGYFDIVTALVKIVLCNGDIVGDVVAS